MQADGAGCCPSYKGLFNAVNPKAPLEVKCSHGRPYTLQPSFSESCPPPNPKSDLFPVLCHWANIDFLSLSVASGTETNGAGYCLLPRRGQGRLSAEEL